MIFFFFYFSFLSKAGEVGVGAKRLTSQHFVFKKFVLEENLNFVSNCLPSNTEISKWLQQLRQRISEREAKIVLQWQKPDWVDGSVCIWWIFFY